MSNFDTINAITDNLEEVLRKQGALFIVESIEDQEVLASQTPLGRIFYKSEVFDVDHGEQAKYSEGEFLIQVVLRERNNRELIRGEQKWVHKIRDNVKIDPLNINALLTSKLVSQVRTEDVIIDNQPEGVSIVNYTVFIRYREEQICE